MSVQAALQVFADPAGLFRAAADEFARCVNDAVTTHGRFTVALSGGSTPKSLYALLASYSTLPWDKIYFFFGDERHVAPDDEESNFRMANEVMFSVAPVAAKQIHRIRGEEPDAATAAQEYEQDLRIGFALAYGQLPRFDLVLLGMGPEGHTASLFPGTKALKEAKRLVVHNWVGKLYTDRITLTPPVLNNAARILFLVHGAEKAPALKAVLEGPDEPEQLPAQIIQPRYGSVLWLVDPTAAGMLTAKAKAAV